MWETSRKGTMTSCSLVKENCLTPEQGATNPMILNCPAEGDHAIFWQTKLPIQHSLWAGLEPLANSPFTCWHILDCSEPKICRAGRLIVFTNTRCMPQSTFRNRLESSVTSKLDCWKFERSGTNLASAPFIPATFQKTSAPSSANLWVRGRLTCGYPLT